MSVVEVLLLTEKLTGASTCPRCADITTLQLTRTTCMSHVFLTITVTECEVRVNDRYVRTTTASKVPSFSVKALTVQVANMWVTIKRDLYTPSEDFIEKLLQKNDCCPDGKSEHLWCKYVCSKTILSY